MRLTYREVWEILGEYPDKRGYDLAIREDPDGALSLNDGVVNIDITQHTAQQLRQEIEKWIATADDDETPSDTRVTEGERRNSVIKMAEELAELDIVSDTIWTLREEVLADLKSEGFLPVSATGPDNQILIDAVIRLLLELI